MQGYLIGNGVTDPVFDGNALVPFARGNSLISEGLFLSLHRGVRRKFLQPPRYMLFIMQAPEEIWQQVVSIVLGSRKACVPAWDGY